MAFELPFHHHPELLFARNTYPTIAVIIHVLLSTSLRFRGNKHRKLQRITIATLKNIQIRDVSVCSLVTNNAGA